MTKRHDDDAGEPITQPVEVAELPYEEAWLLAGRLRSEDIPATVFPEDVSTATYAMRVSRFHSVLVPKEFVDDARRVVEEVAKGV